MSDEAATRIQSNYRGFRARKSLKKRLESTVILQRAFRKHSKETRSAKLKPFLIEQLELDKKLAATRNRKAIREREFQMLSLMSASRVKTYQDELYEKAAITSRSLAVIDR